MGVALWNVGMCNGTWVCFDCRLAVRRPTWRHVTWARPWLLGRRDVGDVRCGGCGQPCLFLGPTIEIPPKRDAAAWKALREHVEHFGAAAVAERFEQSVRRRHDLEHRIREIEDRPASPGREALLKRLRARLAEDLTDGPPDW
jgi:hypothetical protein